MGFSRDNLLDQQLDIAGSFNPNDDLTISDEASGFGAPIGGQSGSSASISESGGNVTVSGLTGMTDESLGRFLTITGSDTGANNGTFLIIQFNSATSVDISNSSGTTDANNGSISWVERQTYSLEDDLNYERSDRAAIKGVAYSAAIPTYFRCTDQNTAVPANLSNIAGKTTDAKSLVINKKFENESVSVGDGYILLSSAGNLPYADSVDLTGVPVEDGFDSGNDDATYVEIIADGYGAGLEVLTGGNAGNRIYGRTRGGTSGVDGYSVEIEFRSVPVGSPLSSSVAYTWESNQPETIDVYIGYRECLDSMDESALRTTLVNGLISDSSLRQDIIDIRTTIGSLDNDTDLGDYLTNTTNFYPFSDLPDATPSVVEALNVLNEQIGDRTFSGATLGASDGNTVTELLQTLATALDSGGGGGGDGYTIVRTIERLDSAITVGTEHTLPGGLSYNTDSSDNGRFLWVFWRGILRDPGTVSEGDDYEETSSSSVTLYKELKSGDHINYFVVTV